MQEQQTSKETDAPSPPPISMDDIFILADNYKTLREIRDETKALLAEYNKDLEIAKFKLTEAMAKAECPKFAKGDKQFILTCTTHYSVTKEQKDALYAALKEKGFEHLFTVNSQTLGSFVREQITEYANEHDGEEQMPEWLQDFISSYDDFGITMRKN